MGPGSIQSGSGTSRKRRGARGTPVSRNLDKVLATITFLGAIILISQIAEAQSFAVRNPSQQRWPQAEAEKICKFATRLVEDEFNPREPIRPEFTLVLGYDKDQMDVNTNELRLRKWDRRMFTEGVILFAFEKMMPAATKAKLVERALKESDSVRTVDQALESAPKQ